MKNVVATARIQGFLLTEKYPITILCLEDNFAFWSYKSFSDWDIHRSRQLTFIMGGCSGGSSSFLVDAQQQCSGDSEEGECKIDETGVSEGGTDPVPAKVLIINHGENPVVHFLFQTQHLTLLLKILINDISSHRAINLDSFIGHEIEMSDKTSGELLKKHTVVIEASENEKSALEALGGSYFPHPVNYISSFPRPSREIPMGAKFRNLYPHDLEYYYDDGTEHGAYNGVIPSMGRSMINTYTTHSFHICKRGSKVKIDKVTMVAKKNIIILAPKNDEKYMEDVKKTQFYKDVMKEVEFTTKYQQQKGTRAFRGSRYGEWASGWLLITSSSEKKKKKKKEKKMMMMKKKRRRRKERAEEKRVKHHDDDDDDNDDNDYRRKRMRKEENRRICEQQPGC
eukprot:jgi/Bigna1/132405/aug1.17_g7113